MNNTAFAGNRRLKNRIQIMYLSGGTIVYELWHILDSMQLVFDVRLCAASFDEV